MQKKDPDLTAFNVHVGQRIRLRRTLLGMSQDKLGQAIGLSFQQVQKYELGTNRVSAGMLWRLSHVLDVPVSFFFDCYEGDDGTPLVTPLVTVPADPGLSRREARLVRLWRQVPTALADTIMTLLANLAGDAGAKAPAPQPQPVAPQPEPATEPADPAATRPARRRPRGTAWTPDDIQPAAA